MQTRFYTPPVDDVLLEFFPEWVIRETRVAIDVPEAMILPGILWDHDHSLAVSEATIELPSGWVKVGSTPGPKLIVLHPEYYISGTASGEALRAHEYFHIWQYRVVPNFIKKYAEEAGRIRAEGKSHMANGYERPAYQFEREIREILSERGMPASLLMAA